MKKTVDWGVLTYTMHPYVIGRGYRMLALEDLVEKLAKEGAVFMTMEQAAEEARRGCSSSRSSRIPRRGAVRSGAPQTRDTKPITSASHLRDLLQDRPPGLLLLLGERH